MLGEIGKGHHIAFNILNVGRYKLGAAAIGVLTWRLSAGRFVPVSAIVAIGVAALSLIIPIVS